MQTTRTWDIFCQVIDNYGDIGVCWRLATQLAQRGQQVRLWVDDASALAWMAPQGCANVRVLPWADGAQTYATLLAADAENGLVGNVLIEAFGCTIAPEVIAAYAINTWTMQQRGLKTPVWINLEYLSAEAYVARSHGLASPIMSGSAKGISKWFFYPGFTTGTGGLLRAPDDVVQAGAAQDAHAATLTPALSRTRLRELAQPDRTTPPLPLAGEGWGEGSDDQRANQQHISLFCYEPAALSQLLNQLAAHAQPCSLHVTAGRATAAVKQLFQKKNADKSIQILRKQLSISYLDWIPQAAYDQLLKRCDLNFVRGEDSLVRALWAGQAFVWHIYPQADGAHAAKLHAFLDWLQAPPDLREFHAVWNGLSDAPLPTIDLTAWAAVAQAARTRLLAQDDLVTQLLAFVTQKSLLPPQ
jgi:uncharacterized repeat protein (TIGR03837 family)